MIGGNGGLAVSIVFFCCWLAAFYALRVPASSRPFRALDGQQLLVVEGSCARCGFALTRYRQRHRCQSHVRTITTTTTTRARRVPVPLSALEASHVDGWTRRWRRETAQGAPVAFLPEARGALSEDFAGACPPPQCTALGACGGGAERGGRARDVLRPTGTDAPASGDAAGTSV